MSNDNSNDINKKRNENQGMGIFGKPNNWLLGNKHL